MAFTFVEITLSKTGQIFKQWFKKSIRRPIGPSWSHIQEEGIRPKHYWALEYPVKLIKKYGNIIYFSTFKQYLLAGPQAFEYILKTNHKNYQRAPFFYLKRMKPLFGTSLLVTEGRFWQQRRKIALPAFNQSSIKNYIPTFIKETKAMLTKWHSTSPTKINIMTEMNLLTLNIALKIFCHREFPETILKPLGFSIHFCNWYCSNTLFFSRFKPTINQLRFNWHINKINQILLAIIKERRTSKESFKEDLLQYLLQAKNEETLEPLNDDEILAEFKTHILTGHETTACGLSWMWYLLGLYPHYQERLEKEIDEVLKGRTPTLEDLANLPFTKAIISETFRLYPPIWSIPRINLAPDKVEGFDIPAGSQLTLHIYALHRNPHYWEKANEFYPERFLEKDPDRHPFLYLPFSSGGHTCIASQLAMIESILVTATLSQMVRFTLRRRVKVIPEPCISLRPKGRIWMQPKFR